MSTYLVIEPAGYCVSDVVEWYAHKQIKNLGKRADLVQLGTAAYMALRGNLGRAAPSDQIAFQLVIHDGDDVWKISVDHQKTVPPGEVHFFSVEGGELVLVCIAKCWVS